MKTSAFCAAVLLCVTIAASQGSFDAFEDDTNQNREDLEVGEGLHERFASPVDEINGQRALRADKKLIGILTGAGIFGGGFLAAKTRQRIVATKIVWKAGKKIIHARRSELDESASSDDAAQQELEELKEEDARIEEVLQTATFKDLSQLSSEKVIKAEKYELPKIEIDDWFQTKHDGVVVTLASGRRLLIIKGYEFFRPKSTAVLDARVMSDAWKLINQKESIENSTLGDYVRAADRSKNSLSASARMMELD